MVMGLVTVNGNTLAGGLGLLMKLFLPVEAWVVSTNAVGLAI